MDPDATLRLIVDRLRALQNLPLDQKKKRQILRSELRQALEDLAAWLRSGAFLPTLHLKIEE